MHLLDLPSDLIHLILLHAALSRGVTRALRLKLVCKQFYHHLQPALFESRLLDEFYVHNRFVNLELGELWPIRNRYGGTHTLQSYLAYRVRNETDPAVGRFVEIRQVAQELVRRTEGQADFEKTVEGLCWLALENAAQLPGVKEHLKRNRPDEPPNPGLNLLSAAAYFGYIPLTKSLLSEGHCPTDDNNIFPSPMQLAALAGNAEILEIFQEHLPDYEVFAPRYNLDLGWRGKTGPGAVKGAALRGDMDMVRLALYPPSLATAAETTHDSTSRPSGHVAPDSNQGCDIRNGGCCTRDPEVLQYIDTLFPDSKSNGSILLALHAELGNLEMVRHLLDSGVDINGGGRLNSNPLTIAARYCQAEVVNLLLERGTDPNHMRSQQRGSPLGAAASGGSLTIVRRLLDAGAKPVDDDWSPLTHAARLEHTAMVELFLDMGMNGRPALRKATEEGLESMVELMQKRGIRLT